MTENRFWHIENGTREPTPREIAALCRYFRCSPSILFPELAQENEGAA